MKKISMIALALVMAVAMAVVGFADSSTVVYDGNKFNCEGVSMSGFDNMLPGVEASGQVTVENQSQKNTNIYMSTEVLQTLVGALNSNPKIQAGYTVTLKANDEVLFGYDPVTQKLSGTVVGGGSDKTVTAGLEEWTQSEKRQLIAMLKPGEKVVVTMSILPDGTTTTNDFQQAVGNVEFNFMASDAVTGVEKSQDQTIVTVKTGDNSMIWLLAGVCVVALILLVVLKRKKKGD